MSGCHRRCEVQWVSAIHKDFGLDESTAGHLLNGVVCEYCVVVRSDMVSIVSYNGLSLRSCIPSYEIINVSAGRSKLIVVSTVGAVVV